MDLKGKRVLITGSTDGLGKLLAINLAKQGCFIFIHGKDNEKAMKVLEEVSKANPDEKHAVYMSDFRKPEEIEKNFSTVEHLDILVNNTGLWAEGNTEDISIERIIDLVNVNLTSYLVTTRVLLPVLQKSEFAQILNVSSIAGVEIPESYFHTIYSATKFGVQAFSESMAKEFANKKLRVMGYYPGGMNTDLFKKAGIDYKNDNGWMFDPQESVDAMIFMLTRDKKINVKRMDLINHLEV